jgi:hypothetical protein
MMTIQREALRIKDKRLFEIVNQISAKIYKKNSGTVNWHLTKEFSEIVFHPVVFYVLDVNITSKFSADAARFSFCAKTEEQVYNIASDTLQAWSTSYFSDEPA